MHETQYQRVFLLISIKKNFSRSHSNRNNLIVYPWGLSFHKSKAKEEALLKVASTRVKYNGKNVANVLILTLSYNDIIDVSLYNGDRKRTRKSSKDNIVDSKRCTCMQWKKKVLIKDSVLYKRKGNSNQEKFNVLQARISELRAIFTNNGLQYHN